MLVKNNVILETTIHVHFRDFRAFVFIFLFFLRFLPFTFYPLKTVVQAVESL